ncbi:hypothetical protein DFH07DRAFT_856232 [Mycena maculata]|uniref:DUF6534 domain-containing protein n=1 Tax=Mycena maculata TaxID=230809 RepID=A0AAD7MMM4_9AGAR|nr:hypothetical protein DFH07DRAFT_856232 [Mycena maculata]
MTVLYNAWSAEPQHPFLSFNAPDWKPPPPPSMVHFNSSEAPIDPSQDEINWLAGPRLIGLVFNWALLGVLTTQVYIYHISFPKDGRVLKGLVYTIYFLDWLQTGSATYDAFHWFVFGWGNVPLLYELYSGFLNVPLLSSTIGGMVQIFFGWRIYTLSKSRIAFGIIILLALFQLSGGIGVSYYWWQDAEELGRAPGLLITVGIRLGGSAVVDTLIAVTMTYFLIKSKGLALGHMNSVITSIVRLTIETGTVMACAAIVDLVFFIKVHNGLHQIFGVILCKLYSNSLMVLFNNRLSMRTGGQLPTHYSGPQDHSTFRVAAPPGRSATVNWDSQGGVTSDINMETLKVSESAFTSSTTDAYHKDF